MPIYEYQCTACGHQLDTMQKMSDAPLKLCPACHEEKLEKLVSVTGFQLKGSGWYLTDYKNKPAPETKTEKTATTESSASTTTTTTTTTTTS